MREHQLDTPRTARYVTLGPLDGSHRELWIALHGYGQLARRFARGLATLDDGERLLVAPEGLSRFYLDPSGTKVGTSWMTREDRLSEIADYVRYLDAVLAALPPGSATRPRFTLLGFSQGSATACRWIAQGAARPHRLVIWGGEIPPDLNWTQASRRFQAVDVVLVAGNRDSYATPTAVKGFSRLLETNGVRHRVVRFDGGHELHAPTLEALAAAAP